MAGDMLQRLQLSEGRARLILSAIEQARELCTTNPLVVWCVVETGYALYVREEVPRHYYSGELKQGKYRVGLLDLANKEMPAHSAEIGRVRVKVSSQRGVLVCQVPEVADYELPSGKYTYVRGELGRELGSVEAVNVIDFRRAATEFGKELLLFAAVYADGDRIGEARLGAAATASAGRNHVAIAMEAVKNGLR